MLSKVNNECGVLLHITSLPSPYGIGTLGKAAYQFLDFLSAAGQKYWQILPLVPIGEGNSPYKSTSCFAGEPLLIDLDLLVKKGLLQKHELPVKSDTDFVDYSAVRHINLPILKTAAKRFDTQNKTYKKFIDKNSFWINDYSLFEAFCEVNSVNTLKQMPEEFRMRDEKFLDSFKESHPQAIETHKILQFLFFEQYSALHKYARKKGIKIIGDIPFYVALDSADVWVNPKEFRLGKDLTPLRVAGVPPDIFSDDGQLWGNPLYDFEHQKKNGFLWWQKRLSYCSKLYDVLRIDHFRAFESYYSVPYGADNAKNGIWEKGPNIQFWNTVKASYKNMPVIAEDLGGDEPEVEKLIENTGFPNMKVLQFGFDKGIQNKFLPKNYSSNCVCYTGTHDNDTALGWWESATTDERLLFTKLAPRNNLSVPLKMILMAMHSRAKLVIIPMQDWLQQDSKGRMNTPGTQHGNWCWKMKSDDFKEDLITLMRNISSCRIKPKFFKI